jgi:hypothetical protein
LQLRKKTYSKSLDAGQPKRHLLTTGWSVFVSAKRLVAGDSVLFIWYVDTSSIWCKKTLDMLFQFLLPYLLAFSGTTTISFF